VLENDKNAKENLNFFIKELQLFSKCDKIAKIYFCGGGKNA